MDKPAAVPESTNMLHEDVEPGFTESEVEKLRGLIAACYMMVGVLVHDGAPIPVKWLDTLSAAANGKPFDEEGLLPFVGVPAASPVAPDRAAMLDEMVRDFSELAVRPKSEIRRRILEYAQPSAEGDGWIAVKRKLPTEGEESRVPLWLGNLKYPYEPSIVYGYYEAGRWWSQWGELNGAEVPTLWYMLPLPAPVAKEGRES